MYVLRSILIVFLLVLGRLALAQEPLDIPPPGEGNVERVRIPIKTAEKAIEEGNTGDATNEEALAFSIAAQAKGWVPPDSAGILRPGVRISVTVLIQGSPEFKVGAQRITQSGMIGLPLVQNIEIGGMDIEEVEKLITKKYKEYYRDPLVNVEYSDSTTDPSLSPWGYVTMMGNVASPGPLSIPPTRVLTVSGAVKLAGGTAASANKGAIRIFRPHPEEESVEVIKVDLDILGKRGKQAEDVSLLAGDVIFIPERIF